MLIVFPSGRNLRQTIQVLVLEADNADGIDVAQFALAHSERGGRDFDRTIGCVLPSRQGLQEPACLLSAAAAEFGDHQWQGQSLDDVIRVTLQNPLVSAGQAIFRQHADHFK